MSTVSLSTTVDECDIPEHLIRSSIVFYQQYASSGVVSTEQEIVDAITEHICQLDASRSLLYAGRFYLNNREMVELEPGLYAQLLTSHFDSKHSEMNGISLRVFSTTRGLSELREWIQEIHHMYQVQQQNKLKNQTYFFEEYPAPITYDINGNIQWSIIPKRLQFTMNEFHTNKSFHTLFGKEVQLIRERIDLFLHNKEFYQQRGKPHTIGILLYGVPGCGKTSMIKAILRETGRHGISLKLKDTTTEIQCDSLFNEESLSVIQPSTNTLSTITIPLNKRVYILEDIDCLSDVFHERTGNNTMSSPSTIDWDHVEQMYLSSSPSAPAPSATLSTHVPISSSPPSSSVRSLVCSPVCVEDVRKLSSSENYKRFMDLLYDRIQHANTYLEKIGSSDDIRTDPQHELHSQFSTDDVVQEYSNQSILPLIDTTHENPLFPPEVVTEPLFLSTANALGFLPYETREHTRPLKKEDIEKYHALQHPSTKKYPSMEGMLQNYHASRHPYTEGMLEKMEGMLQKRLEDDESFYWLIQFKKFLTSRYTSPLRLSDKVPSLYIQELYYTLFAYLDIYNRYNTRVQDSVIHRGLQEFFEICLPLYEIGMVENRIGFVSVSQDTSPSTSTDVPTRPLPTTRKSVETDCAIFENSTPIRTREQEIEERARRQQVTNGRAITLSYLLNLLDGIHEGSERIILMTTNRPQVLDKALLRSGRVDLKIEFKMASAEVVRQMFSNYFQHEPTASGLANTIDDRIDSKMTPADISELLDRCWKDPVKAVEYLNIVSRLT